MSAINLKLQGQFKFDLYRPNGELIKSSEYVDNFITNSGVMYPFHFSFADCFRFLSVGEGTQSNSITSVGSSPTTGLQTPVLPFVNIGSRSSWDGGINSSYYAQPGNFGAGCGYVSNPSGVSLIRQWNLPDNTGGVFSSTQTFHEFMVAPGRPYVTGLNGVKFCSCNETDGYGTGLDCSATADYYNFVAQKYSQTNRQQRLKICDATAAFARVLYDFTVVPNSILTITYKLNLIFDTGIHFTSLTYHRGDNVPNWNHTLNSFNSITQPGVMLINDGTIFGSKAPNGNERLQHFDYLNYQGKKYQFDYEYGESFVPPHGAGLEPSSFFLLNNPNNQNTSVYFSSDNLQFLVNPNGGGLANTGNYAPWNTWNDSFLNIVFSSGNIVSSGNNSYQYINPTPSSGNFLTDTNYWSNLGYLNVVVPFSSGAMPYRNDNDAALVSGSSYWYAKPNSFNIRTNSGSAPNISDITTVGGMSGVTFFSTKASLPSFVFPLTSTGVRNAIVLYTYSFENYQFSNPLQVRSMVCSYSDLSYGSAWGLGDDVNLIPFFDVVFSGISGNPDNLFLPTLVSGDSIVNNGTGVVIQNANLNEYNTLDGSTNSIYPIINTYLNWNVPCPQGVIGC